MSHATPFIERLQPGLRHGGFRMDGWWVWCGSAIRGRDGRYHLFASRWPHELPFFEGYKVASEVVRAVADDPFGPYTFEEVVLGDRGEALWDGRMTHNPFICRWADRYALFYIGATFPGRRPSAVELFRGDAGDWSGVYQTIRIGMATAPDPAGPWTRPDAPILDIRPGCWDGSIVTNPSPCATPDGGMLLVYRSNTPGGCRLGVAGADAFGEPFRRLREEPILEFGPGLGIEDPCVFRLGDRYELVAKDLSGKITGEFHAGVHALSANGLDWTLADPPRAWTRTIAWDDGTTQTLGSLERPFVLVEEGEPVCLLAAVADGPGGFRRADNTWNAVFPLA